MTPLWNGEGRLRPLLPLLAFCWLELGSVATPRVRETGECRLAHLKFQALRPGEEGGMGVGGQ